MSIQCMPKSAILESITLSDRQREVLVAIVEKEPDSSRPTELRRFGKGVYNTINRLADLGFIEKQFDGSYTACWDQINQVAAELRSTATTQAEFRTRLIDERSRSAEELLSDAPIAALYSGVHRIPPETQQELLVAVEKIVVSGEQTSLERVSKLVRLGREWTSRCLVAMSESGLLLLEGQTRVVCWEKIHEAYSSPDADSLEVIKTEVESEKTRKRLLEKYNLRSSEPLIANLTLEVVDFYGKSLGVDLRKRALAQLDRAAAVRQHVKVQQIAERLGAHVATTRRTLEALERDGFIRTFRTRKKVKYVIRWDVLEQFVPKPHNWTARNTQKKPTTSAERRKLLDESGLTVSEILDSIELRLAPASDRNVGTQVQRSILHAIARYDSGCMFGRQRLAKLAGYDPKTIDRGLQALTWLGLIEERQKPGGPVLRYVCWKAVGKLLPEKQEEPSAPAVQTKRVPTIRAIFEGRVLPRMLKRQRSHATILELKRAVNRWEAEFPSKLHNVRKIRTRHLEAFQELAQGEGLSNWSVNKRTKAITQIIREACRRGIVDSVPALEMLPTKSAAKYYFKPQQIEAIWQACESARWPNVEGLEAKLWWRCAIVLWWIYGFRTQELTSFSVDRPAIKWSAVSFETETPNPAGTAECELGWLEYVPQKQRWAKPDPLYLPLVPTARAALDVAAAARTSDDAAILPCPRAHKQLYGAWKAIQAEAGVQTKGGTPFELKAFRKTAATYLENHCRGLGAAVCGWADRDVSVVMQRHYAVNELMMVEQLATYQVPECFSELQMHAGVAGTI